MASRWLKRPLILLCAGIALWAVRPATGQAQILEKLEAAVRAQLNQQEQATQEQADKRGATVQEEELPLPGESSSNRAGTASRPNNGLDLVPSAAAAAAPQNQTYLGLDVEEPVGGGIGVRVVEVTNNSPAWKGGFKVGDRILAINGFAIANLDAMIEQIGPLAAGESVRFLVTRGNRNIELVAVLQDAELAAKLAAGAAQGPAWMGAVVKDVSPAFRQQFGINLFRGAAVTSVTPNSPAARAGLRAGDAIAEVNGRRIERATELMDLIAAAQPGEVLDLRVAQGGGMKSLLVTLELQPLDNGGASAPARNRVQNRPRIAPAIPTSDGPAIVPALGNPPAVTNVQPLPFVPPDVPASELLTDRPSMEERVIETAETRRVDELLGENARLRAELAEVNQRLEATQRRLDAILESLRQVTADPNR